MYTPTSNPSISGIITTGDAIYGNAFEFKNGNAIVLVSDTNDSGTSGVDATLIARGSSATKTALFDANGDISFYEDTGTTAKLFWDASAESLGIGTTSPNVHGWTKALSIDGGTSNSFAFHVYRGSIPDLQTADYGTCLVPFATTNQATIAESPDHELSWFYLVTGTNTTGEGPLGTNSEGGVRTNGGPCP